jgi:Protein of unknown function (DUF998)
MSSPQTKPARAALAFGLSIPFLYFGVQLLAAPFYSGYSFLSQDASTLGSSGSSFPALFNTGALLVGLTTLLAAWGFWLALRALGLHPLLAGLTTLALISSGLASLNAALFPLPDPRHSGGLLGLGTFFLPVLWPLVLWKFPDARPLKIYLVLNLLVFIVLIPIMSGLIQMIGIKTSLDLQDYQNFLNTHQGLLQRVTASVVFTPIAFVAYFLLQSLRVPRGEKRKS